MDRHRLAKIIFWFGVGIVLGLLVNSLTACGPTPEPARFATQTPVSSVQQQVIQDEGDGNCWWENLANPVIDCSARKLYCKGTLGTYMECVFIRCGTNPVLSCIGW